MEQRIRKSAWWREAESLPDRRYDELEGVALTDHLQRVHANARLALSSGRIGGYFADLRQSLVKAGADPDAMLRILSLVALLHDIGKTREDRHAEGEHPLTHKRVEMRHPILSLIAALEILPEDLENRDTVLALVEHHDTPFSWYMQFRRSGQIPKREAWVRLDRKIDPRADGTGLLLLAVFKLADIDGHETVEDVIWFVGQANANLLLEKGKSIPVPDQETIRELEQRGRANEQVGL